MIVGVSLVILDSLGGVLIFRFCRFPLGLSQQTFTWDFDTSLFAGTVDESCSPEI